VAFPDAFTGVLFAPLNPSGLGRRTAAHRIGFYSAPHQRQLNGCFNQVGGAAKTSPTLSPLGATLVVTTCLQITRSEATGSSAALTGAAFPAFALSIVVRDLLSQGALRLMNTALTPKAFFADHASAIHHDGDRNRLDSFRTECSDLDRSRKDVHAAILRLREFRPQNQTRLTAAFFANVAAPAIGIPE
jgi:hypothetical protein